MIFSSEISLKKSLVSDMDKEGYFRVDLEDFICLASQGTSGYPSKVGHVGCIIFFFF